MPIPYHRAPRAAREGCAAFLDIVRLSSSRTFYGALLILDARGEPLEFVYNSLAAPAGFLWPERQVAEAATMALAHSLFDACRKAPDLLVCLARLAPAEYCRRELAPSIPLLVVTPPAGAVPEGRVWANEPPNAGMPAHVLFQSLADRGFILEPFSRIAAGLREVYPEATWTEFRGDSA
jgi:hypothetical protein